jgi:hypothetical protein
MLSFAQSTQSSVTMSPQSNAAAQQPVAHQQQPQPEQMAERRAQIYKKQYDLNEQQYKGVYGAELDYMKQMMDMRAKGQQPTPEQNQQMLTAKDEKFKNAMSAEQYTKYSASRPQQQQQQQQPQQQQQMQLQQQKAVAPATTPAGK